MQAATAGPSALVQAGHLGQVDLGSYMNPFTDLVTNNALGKLEEQRQTQNLSNADAAAKANAFGGSRHGVVESMTNQGFAKQGADLSLNAAQSNFLNAQNMAQTDLSRNLQGQMANQQGHNAMAQFNAGLGQQAGLTNAQLAQQAGMFNA